MRVCHTNVRTALALGMSVATLAAAVGCGDDEESPAGGGSSGSVGGASTQAGAGSTAGEQRASSGVTDFVSYTGGKAGKRGCEQRRR